MPKNIAQNESSLWYWLSLPLKIHRQKLYKRTKKKTKIVKWRLLTSPLLLLSLNDLLSKINVLSSYFGRIKVYEGRSYWPKLDPNPPIWRAEIRTLKVLLNNQVASVGSTTACVPRDSSSNPAWGKLVWTNFKVSDMYSLVDS